MLYEQPKNRPVENGKIQLKIKRCIKGRGIDFMYLKALK